MKNISILGATGSIGLSTLNVISSNPDKYKVFALSAKSNWEKMLSLCKEFKPSYAVMVDPYAAEELQKLAPEGVEVLSGISAQNFVASHKNTDYVMAAIVGSAGLASTFSAVTAGKRVMLANKESLVLAGSLLINAAKKHGAQIIPVDSEHSAIFQCLQAGTSGLKKVQLTASGGPFLNKKLNSLGKVTPEQACAHPNWKMGKKISVDSATMMNKGLEVIEAHFLFGLPAQHIEVVIHPQSIVHSFAYFTDGSVLSQLGLPDMRSAISYALSFPERHPSGVEDLDLTKHNDLEFIAPDMQKFKCLELAYSALKNGDSSPATLNAANEIAVEAFLGNRIGFLDISSTIEKTLLEAPIRVLDTLDSVMENDRLSRQVANSVIESSA